MDVNGNLNTGGLKEKVFDVRKNVRYNESDIRNLVDQMKDKDRREKSINLKRMDICKQESEIKGDLLCQRLILQMQERIFTIWLSL